MVPILFCSAGFEDGRQQVEERVVRFTIEKIGIDTRAIWRNVGLVPIGSWRGYALTPDMTDYPIDECLVSGRDIPGRFAMGIALPEMGLINCFSI